jgi:type IV pilus assembly protein PilP
VKHQKHPQRRSDATLATVLLLLALIAGCSDSGQAPPAPSTPIAVKPAQKPITPAPPTILVEKKPQPEYSYNPAGRRDPFAPIISKEEKKEKSRDLPPLQRYDLYDFKLAGIVWGGFGYNAMVEAPDGKGYLVRVGTIIGPNRGVVKKISADKMIIEEKFKNFSGETERKELVIELRKKQEGMQ